MFTDELEHQIWEHKWDILMEIPIFKIVKIISKGRCFLVFICFVAGTDVLTPDGPRDIETIQPGQLVWAFDGETGQWQATEVIVTSETRYDGVMVQVQITDGEGSCETIECTEGHPFWVVGGIALDVRPHAEEAVPLGAEPTAGGQWVEAGSLRAGDTLLTRDGGYAIVSAVTARHERRVVYNLTLAAVHTYAVGDDGVLVHNKCGGETAAAAYGRYIHQNWKYGKGFVPEFRGVKGMRPDAVNLATNTVIELKPNNPTAIARGWRQLNRYVKGLQDEYGGTWIPILRTYD